MQFQLAKSLPSPSKTSQTNSVIWFENTVLFVAKQKQYERPKTASWTWRDHNGVSFKDVFWRELTFSVTPTASLAQPEEVRYLPQLGVLSVHHGRTFCQYFCNANSTDFLFNLSRHFLDFRNYNFLQHHSKHPIVTLREKVLESLISLMVTNENQKQYESLGNRDNQIIC